MNSKQILAHWDEIPRIATFIEHGSVTASLMLRKLGAYPRQNGLAIALREFGRLERSIFLLQCMSTFKYAAGFMSGSTRARLAMPWPETCSSIAWGNCVTERMRINGIEPAD